MNLAKNPQIGYLLTQKEAIAVKLKEFRRRNGMTQEDVAKALGIPKKTYQNYEREVREADSGVLCALADLYGVTLDELMGRTSTISPGELHAIVAEVEKQQDEIVAIFQVLNADGRALLLSIARDIEEYMTREDLSDPYE